MSLKFPSEEYHESFEVGLAVRRPFIIITGQAFVIIKKGISHLPPLSSCHTSSFGFNLFLQVLMYQIV